MMDLPGPRDPIGPAQIQQLLRDLEWCKDMIRSIYPRDGGNVHPNVTSVGTTYTANPAPAPTASTSTSAIIAGQLGRVLVGEWHPGLTINAQNDYIVYSGANAGIWTATEAQNAGGYEPGTGGFYIKTGEIFSAGIWL